jgi:hypothetical protein
VTDKVIRGQFGVKVARIGGPCPGCGDPIQSIEEDDKAVITYHHAEGCCIDSKPLTTADLEHLGSAHEVDTLDVHRLLADNDRLRQLVAVAREHVQPGPATRPSCAETVNRLLDDGVTAAPSALPHATQGCPVKKTEAIEREESEDT